MRCFLIAFFWIGLADFMSLDLYAQAEPSYNIDTARRFSPGCDTLPVYAYFQVKGKYPESSQTLTKWADSALRGRNIPGSANGYISFRILIDCMGKLAAVKLLQTNEHYEPCIFPDDLVTRLYAFLQSLKSWKKASSAGRPVNYFSYLSFKIEGGHVVQISP